MAWAFVGVSNVVEVTATPHALVTTGISGTLQAGDLLVACISSRIASTTSITLPTGGEWTLVSERKNNNTLSTNLAIPTGLMAYCVRGASDPNLTFTHPIAPSVAIGRVVAYREIISAAPKDTQTSFQTATAITAVSGAGLTTSADGDLIVAMTAGGQEAAWSAFNATSPSGASGATSVAAPTTTWLERADSVTTTGADTSLGIFDAVKTTAGATGNLTVTASVAAAHVVIAGAFKVGLTGTGALAGQASALSGTGTSGTPDAWNAGDKSANITLSNSDKTATTVSGAVGVRSTTTHLNETAGKYYAEFSLENGIPGGIVAVGINNLTSAVNTITGASCYLRTDSGNIYANNVIITDITTGYSIVNGDVACIAWDSGAERIWFRINGTDWNGNPAEDPATNTGGINCSFAAAVGHALWFATTSGARVVTIRTEAAEFSYTGPSGFTSWMGETLLAPSVTGTGTPSAAAADADGAGLSSSDGTGALPGAVATLAGEGTVGDVSEDITGIGALTTDGAVVASTGMSSSTGTGSLAGQASAVSGTGTANTLDAWNTADKSANITLSNSDKTATLTAAVTSGVRSTTKYLNGTETKKLYAEFRLTNVVGTISNQVGIREVSASLTSTAGSTFQCASYSGNIVTGNATVIGNIGGSPLVDGDVICMAWSPSTERGWFRKNNGLWNNDAAADPATNTNGLDISVLNNTDHALFFLIASTGNGASTTIRTEVCGVQLHRSVRVHLVDGRDTGGYRHGRPGGANCHGGRCRRLGIEWHGGACRADLDGRWFWFVGCDRHR